MCRMCYTAPQIEVPEEGSHAISEAARGSWCHIEVPSSQGQPGDEPLASSLGMPVAETQLGPRAPKYSGSTNVGAKKEFQNT